jgi:hypothetical protein
MILVLDDAEAEVRGLAAQWDAAGLRRGSGMARREAGIAGRVHPVAGNLRPVTARADPHPPRCGSDEQPVRR